MYDLQLLRGWRLKYVLELSIGGGVNVNPSSVTVGKYSMCVHRARFGWGSAADWVKQQKDSKLCYSGEGGTDGNDLSVCTCMCGSAIDCGCMFDSSNI